VISNI